MPIQLKYLFQGLGRNVMLLGFVSLFTDISSEMLYPIVPLFLTTALNAPMSVVGLIEGIAESTASLLKIVSGWWSDRAGRRQPFVVWGYSLSATSKPLLALASTWHLVLASRLIDRVGKGIRTSPRDAMIAASCDPNARGKAFGLHRAMDTIGAFLGPILAILLLSVFDLSYQTIFMIAFIPATLGVATLAFLRRETPTPKPASGATLPKAPISPELKKFILIYGLFALGNSSDVFLLLKAKEVGLSANGVLLTYVFYNFVYALAAMPAGWLSDKLSRRALMIGGLVVFAVVYTGFAFAPNKTRDLAAVRAVRFLRSGHGRRVQGAGGRSIHAAEPRHGDGPDAHGDRASRVCRQHGGRPALDAHQPRGPVPLWGDLCHGSGRSASCDSVQHPR